MVITAIKLRIPNSLISGVLRRLQIEDPSQLFTVLKSLARIYNKSAIATNFSHKSKDSNNKSFDYCIADWLNETQRDVDLNGNMSEETKPWLQNDWSTKLFTPEEIGHSLSRIGHKAVRVDGLSSRILKKQIIPTNLKRKA